jgi:hypothetical protein
MLSETASQPLVRSHLPHTLCRNEAAATKKLSGERAVPSFLLFVRFEEIDNEPWRPWREEVGAGVEDGRDGRAGF